GAVPAGEVAASFARAELRRVHLPGRGVLAVRGDEHGSGEQTLAARSSFRHPEQNVGSMFRGDRLHGATRWAGERLGELRERVARHVAREEQLPRKEEVRLCRGDGPLEFLQVLRLVADRRIELGERRLPDCLGLGKGAPPGKSFCSRGGLRITGPQATTWIVWPTVEDGDG